MSNHEYIHIAEAYDKNGKRVQRIAHTTREGAKEDIEIYVESHSQELITNVCPLRLHGGSDGVVTNIETKNEPPA